jgi:hypothetical protein
MDIQEILDGKIKALPAGLHLDGLRAVKSHIDAAVRHLLRGQTAPDESLFTDVIFRCNQAFEGSIKEAFRVLAGKDPQHKTPADIEKFLAAGNILRKKVLDQFTTYRKEWRNPSTHDYTLDFDEDEALVAIVSVTVFAIVLCDQIDSKLAFNDAAAGKAGSLSKADKEGPLLDLVTSKIVSFATNYGDGVGSTSSTAHDYYRLEGALAGHLSAELATVPSITITQGKRLMEREADIVIEKGPEKVVVELKRTPSLLDHTGIAQRGVRQVSLHLEAPDVSAVVLVYSTRGAKEYDVAPGPGILSKRVRIVAPRVKPPAP